MGKHRPIKYGFTYRLAGTSLPARRYLFEAIMKIIELTQGKNTLVDDADYEWLNQWKWCYHDGYANRQDRPNGPGTPQVNIKMHRLIMGCTKGDGIKVDHKNGDTTNNQRYNLRKSTMVQNIQNQKRRSTNKSGYKGVRYTTFKSGRGAWRACITVNNHRYHLGYFHSAEIAARVYDEAARNLMGEFARLNFSGESS